MTEPKRPGRPPGTGVKPIKVTARFSPDTDRLLRALSTKYGVPMTDTISIAIRELAKREGIR